jgi:hypothetical protein
MARGDHIRVRRQGYWHHGIDCGDGTVIHYTGSPFEHVGAAIRLTSLDDFAKGGKVKVVSSPAEGDADLVIARAESRLGETTYHVLTNNCEHFARWCSTGRHESKQVLRVAASLCIGAGLFLVGFAGAKLAARYGVRSDENH